MATGSVLIYDLLSINRYGKNKGANNMPFDPSIVPERLIEAVQRRNLIPLIGAGISRQAGDAFPNWRELLASMKDRAVTEGHISQFDGEELERLMDKGQFLMAAEALRDRFPSDEYGSLLEENFDPDGIGPAEIHKALFRLNPPMILTTNYDRLLEDGYAEEYGRSIRVYTYLDAAVAQRYLLEGRFVSRPILYKIHGTIDDPASVILSERDYRELKYRQRGYRLILSAIFLTNVVLMLGFSFADPELRLHMEDLRESLKHRNEPDYMLLPENAIGPVETRRLREDFGVQAIFYEPSPGHPEVLEFVNYLASQL
jgi:hypothetical protein